jgi:hypothetical protein
MGKVVNMLGEEVIKLNIGCGFTKEPGWLGVDKNPEYTPDILVDLENKDLTSCDTDLSWNSVDVIKCWDFLEHINPLRCVGLMGQFWELLKPGGILDIRVPSTDGRGAFQNPLHKSYWNKNSFLYYLLPDLKKEIGFEGEFKPLQLFDQITGDQVIHVFVKFETVKGDKWNR